jgi:hypothetical protein
MSTSVKLTVKVSGKHRNKATGRGFVTREEGRTETGKCAWGSRGHTTNSRSRKTARPSSHHHKGTEEQGRWGTSPHLFNWHSHCHTTRNCQPLPVNVKQQRNRQQAEAANAASGLPQIRRGRAGAGEEPGVVRTHDGSRSRSNDSSSSHHFKGIFFGAGHWGTSPRCSNKNDNATPHTTVNPYP